MGGIASIPFGNIKLIVTTAKQEPVSIIWMIGLVFVTTIMPYFFYSWGIVFLNLDLSLKKDLKKEIK